jgi:2,5-diketo-D-gluconate reductase A
MSGNAAIAIDKASKRFALAGSSEGVLALSDLSLQIAHFPCARTLEEFKADGRARSIGVSNFQVAHLGRLVAESDTVPAVNQIELHPYCQNREVVAYGREHGIATEAWAPIAQGKVLDNPTLLEIAERYARSVAQVVLRWQIQQGNIVFPKSVTPERIRENFELFDFELSPDDMSAIEALDAGERIGPDPETFVSP